MWQPLAVASDFSCLHHNAVHVSMSERESVCKCKGERECAFEREGERECVFACKGESKESGFFFEGTFIHIYAALNRRCKHTVHTCLLCLNATTLHLHPAVKSAFSGCVVWLTPPSKTHCMYLLVCKCHHNTVASSCQICVWWMCNVLYYYFTVVFFSFCHLHHRKTMGLLSRKPHVAFRRSKKSLMYDWKLILKGWFTRWSLA